MKNTVNGRSSTNDNVIAHFEKDNVLVKHLIADLQEEQAALINIDLDQIENLLDKRLSLLESISISAKNRYDALAQAGFDASEKGMADWLKQQSNTALDRAWGDFQKQVIQAKELNRLNGVLISKQFQRNRERLNVLQGKTNTSQMYGKNGQARTDNSSRAFLQV